MSVTTFFEKIIGLQQQRSQQKQNSYRELVAGIATGEEPSPAEVERLLAEAKKSITDLQRDVETYQHRMALKAMVASLPKLEEEFAQVQQQIAAADHDLEAAERLHDEITGPLYGRLHEIKEARKDASQASQELYETCDSPNLEQKVTEINAEIERLNKSAWDLAIQAAYLDNKAEAERHQAEKELTAADREHRLEQAALFEKQAESLRQRVKSSQKAQADAVKRREQIEDRMRQW